MLAVLRRGLGSSRTLASVGVARTLTGASGRPFRVLGLQQVAIGGLDKSRLSALWEGVLGVEKVGEYVSEKENVDEDILKLGVGPYAVEVDLMQPLDPERAPKVHVPALNHIGLWVDRLDVAVAYLEANGVRFAPGGIRKGASGHDVTFIHPKGNASHPLCGEGILLELVQAPEDVIAAYDKGHA
jgi:lactoylglutathione lyase